MSQYPKVLWGEGLFLRPQHFQLQDQYHENRLAQIFQTLQPYSYGIRKCTLDTSLLSSGTVAFQVLDVVFPDGEIYNAPSTDCLPASVQIDLAEASESIVVWACLPSLRLGGGNISNTQKGIMARYIESTNEQIDLFTQAVTADIHILQRQAKIALGRQPSADEVYFPVTCLIRNSMGQYEEDKDFIPPILSIGASNSLMSFLRRLLNLIQSKISALYHHHREPSENLLEFRSGDITSFWLLHTLNAGYSTLNHYLQNTGIHPERLHLELLRLASSMMTFGKQHQLGELPAYQHAGILKSVQLLEQIIRDLLDTVISSRLITIPLQESRPSYWIGHLNSDKIDQQARLYLAVSSSLPLHEIVVLVPQRFKVGSPDDVEQRVVAALPAISITHLTQVPSAIPVRPGYCYFSIDPYDPLYERALRAESICVYFPSGFGDIKTELVAITQ